MEPDTAGRPAEDPLATTLLVRRAFEGELGAFDALHERVAPALCIWVHHRMGPALRRACDPEDVLQEVWHRAYTSLTKHDPTRASFRSWIFGVAKHVLLELIRHSARLARTKASGDTSQSFRLSNVHAKITGPLQRVVRDTTIQRVRNLIAELPEEDQELVVRCGLEGASCEEAALRLGISREAATKRWQRLRERLREHAGLAAMMDG